MCRPGTCQVHRGARAGPSPALPCLPVESCFLSKQAVPAKSHILHPVPLFQQCGETSDMSENIPSGESIIRTPFPFPCRVWAAALGAGAGAGRPLGLGASCLSSPPDPAPVLSLHLQACGSPSPLRRGDRPHAGNHCLSCLLTTRAAETERAGDCSPDGSEA